MVDLEALQLLLKRDDFSSNRHPALAYCWSLIFFRKPVSTFRDHALGHRAAASGSYPRHALGCRTAFLILGARLDACERAMGGLLKFAGGRRSQAVPC